MPGISDRTKPRAREHSTPRPKPSNKIISLFIIDGPDRAELYHESEFCLDGTSGPNFRSKFIINTEQKHCFVQAIHTCILGIEHHPDAAYNFKLRGKVRLTFPAIKKSDVYPFTATYDAQHHTGTIRIKVPLTDLPTADKILG